MIIDNIVYIYNGEHKNTSHNYINDRKYQIVNTEKKNLVGYKLSVYQQ